MMKLSRRQVCMTGLALLAAAPLSGAAPAVAQQLKGGTLRVGVLSELANFDPQQLSTVNFHVIKNLYDSLIEYTPEESRCRGWRAPGRSRRTRPR